MGAMKKPKETSAVKFEAKLDDPRNKSVDIFIGRGDDRMRVVSVYKQSTIRDARWDTAGINWVALGSQEMDTTSWFILALQAAVKWARWLDRQYPVGTVAR
jgi:hypothetical protein